MDVQLSCMYTQSLSWKIMGLLVHMANDFEKKIFFVNQTTVATDFLVTIIIVL